ncbi:2-amino-4-hydroxy-6-hydroxymethyldihydropteridinediphosphokinase [Raineyella antarctica]|uniref:2-amino-4-hydroxy-6-hydroxymethyldihydropteridine diphosphokinase n=1 Tax=Raineyella antarctica TaxID=1577474 RepID=A0A1G6IJL0_9ACTN|nr:2-amino-4-hydroxy-6-hydroxymethyldihydropteridine diphosphokinase [Raineyella antarctica]SDC06641.1 2-amino-4-hydroxy-6-hydroxymethyldihydropteridinediphosphokinase [Raineyella antarctica]
MSTPTTPFEINADTLSMRALRKVVFSIGSNLGDRREHLEEAVMMLRSTPGLEVVAVSPIYETRAVGGPADNPDFLNAVVVAETVQSAEAMLARIGAIEEAGARTREVHWGPRTLDVDIITYGDKTIDLPELTVPHPRAHERAFVLVPWADIDPDATIPGHGSVRDLLAGLDTSAVRRLGESLTE